jgi:DNA-binding NarL/FixJ family response regulator
VLLSPDRKRDKDGSADQPVRVVIAHELPIFREGLRLLLTSDPRLQVIGHTGIGAAAADLVRELQPDVLVLGCSSSDTASIDMLHQLVAAGVSVRTILLVKSIDAPEIADALRTGVRGVVARDAEADLVVKSIDAVIAGECWIGHERTAADPAALIRRFEQARLDAQPFRLTPRELAIVRRVINGDTNAEIAAVLEISENTVKRHLMNIFNKTGTSSRVELALFASDRRLLGDL